MSTSYSPSSQALQWGARYRRSTLPTAHNFGKNRLGAAGHFTATPFFVQYASGGREGRGQVTCAQHCPCVGNDMFEGVGFRTLAMLVTVLTVVVGVVCVVAGWGVVISDQYRVPTMRVPYALYTLTLAVLFQLTSLMVLLRIPYDLAEIFGTARNQVVWVVFLVASFALGGFSLWLARKASGPATSLLRISTILLVAIWGVGLISYMAGD